MDSKIHFYLTALFAVKFLSKLKTSVSFKSYALTERDLVEELFTCLVDEKHAKTEADSKLKCRNQNVKTPEHQMWSPKLSTLCSKK